MPTQKDKQAEPSGQLPAEKSNNKKSNTGPLQARSLKSAERQLQAMEYRRQGKSFRKIAKLLGLASQGTVFDLVKSALAETRDQCKETAEEHREEELERLDAIHEAMYECALAGDAKAAAVCVNVSKRRAAMLGLDQPAKVEHSGTVKTYAIAEFSPECPAWPKPPSQPSGEQRPDQSSPSVDDESTQPDKPWP